MLGSKLLHSSILLPPFLFKINLNTSLAYKWQSSLFVWSGLPDCHRQIGRLRGHETWLVLNSWRSPTEEYHPCLQSVSTFIIPACWGCTSHTKKGKMVKTPRGAYRLLLSTAKGAGVLEQLGHFEYDWLKQVPIIFVHSNWPGLARDWLGL